MRGNAAVAVGRKGDRIDKGRIDPPIDGEIGNGEPAGLAVVMAVSIDAATAGEGSPRRDAVRRPRR